MADKGKPKETEKGKVILPVTLEFKFDKLTDGEIGRLKRAWASLAPDDSFVGKPKRVHDPRRARPL